MEAAISSRPPAIRPFAVSIHAPCARGDKAYWDEFAPVKDVSIHAPARGATNLVAHGDVDMVVSIHAPARGATTSSPSISAAMTCFDPRPCARGDPLASLHGVCRPRFRSTPLREGRRAAPPATGPALSSFDPRPCARGDQRAGRIRLCRESFDPRPCARGDGRPRSPPPPGASFDPRPRARGDQVSASRPMSRQAVSIHAPARGATAYQCRRVSSSSGFDPRPRARGDNCCKMSMFVSWCFDPRPRARGDDRPGRKPEPVAVSIHAPARGATGLSQESSLPSMRFRSTPLREGRPRLVSWWRG